MKPEIYDKLTPVARRTMDFVNEVGWVGPIPKGKKFKLPWCLGRGHYVGKRANIMYIDPEWNSDGKCTFCDLFEVSRVRNVCPSCGNTFAGPPDFPYELECPDCE